MTAPSKAERDAAVAAVVALPGSAYTAWRQRLRHTLAKRRWAPHGFVLGSAEFNIFLGIYDGLVARFGVAADERFTAYLKGITKARRQSKRQQYNAAYRLRPSTNPEARRRARSTYNAIYRARPRTDEELAAERLARAAYMRTYRNRPRTPEQQVAERAGRAAYMRRYRSAMKTEEVAG